MHFLCLHGIGTNSKIFEMQTAAIRYELGDNHTYEFLEGTVPWAKAPEIKSLFPGDTGFFAFCDNTSPADTLKALNDLDAYIAAEGPFDGVIAFSQPATLVIALMIHKLKQDPEGQRANPLFKCAILFSPALMPADYADLQEGAFRTLSAATDGEIIDIPTAHIWGSADPWAATGYGLSRMCRADVRSVFIHDGGHEVPGPGAKAAVTRTVNVIRRAVDTAMFE